MLIGENKTAGVLNPVNVTIALILHVLFFLGFWIYSSLDRKKELTVIPIDLTVVVQENLDGDENEPPPLKPPESEPEPEPVKPPEPPPPPPEPVTEVPVEAVEKIPEKKPEKKTEKKIEKPKPPEPQKKTAKELREERIKKMRERAKNVKRMPDSSPQPNGKTEKKTLSDAEIQKLLNAGYRPGRSNQLATSEEQRCLSLIKRAFESRWDKPPYTDTLRPMVLNVRFGGGGRIVSYRLEESSGDRQADDSILRAAKAVGAVPGLSASFLDKYSGGISVRFTVERL